MNKSFIDICYAIVSHYLHFPDVADTYKNITDGLSYQSNFPWDITDFLQKKDEIVLYIEKVRIDNIIDEYRGNENPLALIPVPSGKLLSKSNQSELYQNLSNEIPRLIMKAIHQIIKNLYTIWDDNVLTAELLQQDVSVLQRYGLLNK